MLAVRPDCLSLVFLPIINADFAMSELKNCHVGVQTLKFNFSGTDCQIGPRKVLMAGRYCYLDKSRDPHFIADGIFKALVYRIHPVQLAATVRPFEEEAVIARHFALLGLSEHDPCVVP
jgi:hypothetical protein